jgi:hypothetical protein
MGHPIFWWPVLGRATANTTATAKAKRQKQILAFGEG